MIVAIALHRYWLIDIASVSSARRAHYLTASRNKTPGCCVEVFMSAHMILLCSLVVHWSATVVKVQPAIEH